MSSNWTADSALATAGKKQRNRQAGKTWAFGIIVGTIAGLNEEGELLVDHPRNRSGLPIRARSVVAIRDVDHGREVVLQFEEGDPTRPVVMGLLQDSSKARPVEAASAGSKEVETLNLVAGREISLRCGAASITLTRAGKVLIRGSYVLSRSSGANRIKGGSVQIN